MLRKIISLGLLMLFAVCVSKGFSQEKTAVEGVIEQISDDNSFIVIGGEKINAEPGFIEDSYLESGDWVRIIAEKTEEGLKAVDYDYLESETDPSQEE